MIDDIKADAESKMKKTIEALKRELVGIRTGRASPALIEPLKVDYYGTATPLQQIAAISAPEARLLAIKPYDQSSLSAIEKAILKSDLGLTPVNDGRVVRLAMPQLTEERRRDLVRVSRKKVEEGRVAVRNCRRDAHEHLKELQKEKHISEDESKRSQERLQRITNAYVEDVDSLGEKKEQEILEV